jgi:hypothetical protein
MGAGKADAAVGFKGHDRLCRTAVDGVVESPVCLHPLEIAVEPDTPVLVVEPGKGVEGIFCIGDLERSVIDGIEFFPGCPLDKRKKDLKAEVMGELCGLFCMADGVAGEGGKEDGREPGIDSLAEISRDPGIGPGVASGPVEGLFIGEETDGWCIEAMEPLRIDVVAKQETVCDKAGEVALFPAPLGKGADIGAHERFSPGKGDHPAAHGMGFAEAGEHLPGRGFVLHRVKRGDIAEFTAEIAPQGHFTGDKIRAGLP